MEKYLAYLRNIVDAAKGGQIQPLYSVMGEGELNETTAAYLAGYRGMGPVRNGNAAYKQIQHDCYGQIVLPNVQGYFDQRLLRMADESDFESLEQVGEMAFAMHDQPDAGLWEFRTRQEVHTYSAVMCWAACDRLANVAEHLGKPDRDNAVARAGRHHPRAGREGCVEGSGGLLRRLVRNRLSRCQPAADGRTALHQARRSALPRDFQRGREGAAARANTCCAMRPRTISARPRPRSTSAPSG